MKKLLPFLLFVLLVLSIEAQVNITFELNAETIENIDPTGLYIAGGTAFGTPGDNQLLDGDGDGIYTVTIQKEQGVSSNYTFLNGNCPDWGCKENLAGLPCGDPQNFNDRYLPPVMADTTIMACFGTCDSDGTCTIVTDSIDITFELNTATIDVDLGGVFIAGGGNFGNPGDYPMSDPDGDGIYSITIKKPMGLASYYTFLNGNCPDYSCKENLAGLPCGDPLNFNDRFFPSVMSDTTIMACFGTCDDDGGCTIVLDSIDITFELNTSTIDVDPGGVFLAGGGNFGNPGDNPMIDPEADGIYTITVRKPMGLASYYTFLNGNCPDWSCKENLEGLPCGDPNNFNDRFLPSVMSDTTILACFGECTSDGTCSTSSVEGLQFDKDLFDLRPTLAYNYVQVFFDSKIQSVQKQITLMSTSGQVLDVRNSINESVLEINTADHEAGIYFIQLKSDSFSYTKKFVVQK